MEAMVALTSGSSYLSVSLEMQFPSIKDSDAAPIVFFRPVESSLSHHTLLGTTFHRKFDFLAQVFVAIPSETERHSKTEQILRVAVGEAHGHPITVQLSHLPYSDLSAKLRVWGLVDSCYHVCQNMQLGGGGGEVLPNTPFYQSQTDRRLATTTTTTTPTTTTPTLTPTPPPPPPTTTTSTTTTATTTTTTTTTTAPTTAPTTANIAPTTANIATTILTTNY